jgi:hypothetical protein
MSTFDPQLIEGVCASADPVAEAREFLKRRLVEAAGQSRLVAEAIIDVTVMLVVDRGFEEKAARRVVQMLALEHGYRGRDVETCVDLGLADAAERLSVMNGVESSPAARAEKPEEPAPKPETTKASAKAEKLGQAPPKTMSERPAMTSEIVCFTKSGGPLTKRIYLTEDGSSKSDGSACVMSHGIAQRFQISGVARLGKLLEQLQPNQAIALGALRAGLPDKAEITTKGALNGSTRPDVIARTGANIIYRPGQSAFALIDFDTKGMPPEVCARLDELGGCWPALLSVIPGLCKVARITRASTSAGLYRSDSGEAVPGSNGEHIYIAVRDGADVERFLKTLHERCWLNGLGWMMIGAGGQLLERSIVDRMVGPPERLVFEGAPSLEPPLAQDLKARRPIVTEGDALDTHTACPPLTVREKARLQELRSKDAHRLAGDSAKARAAFIDKQSAQLAKRTGVSRQVAKDIIAKQCKGELLPLVALPFDAPELEGKTVADVLADPERFEGETLADPLEGIEYGRGKAKIMRRADGTPWVHSFAHGRAIYQLKLDAAAVRAAMDAAAKEEVIPTLIRLALQASMDAAELEDLIAHAKERTGRGIRAIRGTLKQARAENAAEKANQERNRRLAERQDARPELPAPDPEAPYLPEMAVYNDVLGKPRERIPPSRNIEGTMALIKRIKIAGTHTFISSEDSNQ